MKLLFDENLSPNLPLRLNDLFPNSLHVRDVGMKSTKEFDKVTGLTAEDWQIFVCST
ncbi:DUF5615 family PIN-like protein [Microcoleus sp. T3_B1]|uniref:DUF5615 family PIN-like protein n=1 Tax=Microcoleus sp. T3_B1 TaxID=3055425 RepID=UPI002FD70A45